MTTIYSSETLIGSHRIRRRYIPDDRILQLFVNSAVFKSQIKISPLFCVPISLFLLGIVTWQGCCSCSCAPFRARNVKSLYLWGYYTGNVCDASEIIKLLPYGLSKDDISTSLGSRSHPPHADLTDRGPLIPRTKCICFGFSNVTLYPI
jgi:hypothetical protein